MSAKHHTHIPLWSLHNSNIHLVLYAHLKQKIEVYDTNSNKTWSSFYREEDSTPISKESRGMKTPDENIRIPTPTHQKPS